MMSLSDTNKLRLSYKIFNHFSKLEKRVFKLIYQAEIILIISEFLV